MDKQLLWLKLFAAETEEDLAALEETGVKEIKEAIQAYRQITADPVFRESVRLSEKARHNKAAALRNARDEGDGKKAQGNLP
ncbi:MAG: hypothetical protein LBU82_06725 [Treponema sp.]|jgi:hypothetical protein|nr:hypothetical protein [Treponema sp.]